MVWIWTRRFVFVYLPVGVPRCFVFVQFLCVPDGRKFRNVSHLMMCRRGHQDSPCPTVGRAHASSSLWSIMDILDSRRLSRRNTKRERPNEVCTTTTASQSSALHRSRLFRVTSVGTITSSVEREVERNRLQHVTYPLRYSWCLPRRHQR